MKSDTADRVVCDTFVQSARNRRRHRGDDRKLRARVRSAELSALERADFSTAHVDGTEELARVVTVVDALYTHLCSPAIVDEISAANQPGQSSGVVQGVFVGEARQSGFRDESKGLFSDYESSAAPPRLLPALRDGGGSDRSVT